MPFEDYQNLTEADFEGLPPLVPEGANREEILAGVIDRWVEAASEWEEYNPIMPLEMKDQKTVDLKGTDIKDANPDAEPIDLIKDLLFPYLERLKETNGENQHQKKTPPVILTGCLIHGLEAFLCELQVDVEIYKCHLSGGINFHGTKFRGDLSVASSLIDQSVDFNSSEIRGDINFSKTIFLDYADFSYAKYFGDSKFLQVVFNKPVTFTGSTFDKNFDFRNVKSIEDALFSNSQFNNDVYFGKSFFEKPYTCLGSLFASYSDFSDIVFHDETTFVGSKFLGQVHFNRSRFYKYSSFSNTLFSKGIFFLSASFYGGCDFFYADLRKAKLTKGYLPLTKQSEWNYSWHSLQIVSIKKNLIKIWKHWFWTLLAKEREWKSIVYLPCWIFEIFAAIKQHLREHIDWQYLADRIEWSWVRSLGELNLLTRVSYFSLVGVPLLAGLWGPVRTWILQMNEGLEESIVSFEEEVKQNDWQDLLAAEPIQSFLDSLKSSTLDESMPVGWLLAFSAALSVVVAQFIYQTWAPNLVKLYKEEDLVEESNELIRRGEEITNNWLRESVDYLQDAWQRMPHRHNAWFVKRGLRTVWIPDHVEEHFVDAREVDRSVDAPDDREPPIAQQEVLAEDRKRIAIEEGQKARYAIEVFTNRKAAWLSGGFYIVGGVLTIFIILRQMSYVLAASEASDWAWIPRYLSNGWFVFWVTILMLLLTFLGWWFVKEPTEQKTDE